MLALGFDRCCPRLILPLLLEYIKKSVSVPQVVQQVYAIQMPVYFVFLHLPHSRDKKDSKLNVAFLHLRAVLYRKALLGLHLTTDKRNCTPNYLSRPSEIGDDWQSPLDLLHSNPRESDSNADGTVCAGCIDALGLYSPKLHRHRSGDSQ